MERGSPEAVMGEDLERIEVELRAVGLVYYAGQEAMLHRLAGKLSRSRLASLPAIVMLREEQARVRERLLELAVNEMVRMGVSRDRMERAAFQVIGTPEDGLKLVGVAYLTRENKAGS